MPWIKRSLATLLKAPPRTYGWCRTRWSCAALALELHDKCTRNHKRKRLRELIGDVERHLHANGPWLYKLSRLYYEPGVTAAVERITAEAQAKSAA